MAIDYVLPRDLTADLLSAVDDETLLAYEDHYGAVLASCQEQHAAQTELLGLTETAASDAALGWLSNTIALTDRQVTAWLRALQMTCTERKRRDEEARREAHRVQTLLEAATYLEEETMLEAAKTCRTLAGEDLDSADWAYMMEAATAGAGL